MKCRSARSPNGTSAICTPGGYQPDRIGKFGRSKCGGAPMAVSRFVASARCSISWMATPSMAPSHARIRSSWASVTPSSVERLSVNSAKRYSHIRPCSSSQACVSR